LIGGLTLALAMIAQSVAADYESRALGLLIVSIGMSVVGFFSAVESQVTRRGDAARAGAVAGLIAGIFLGLAFVAGALINALRPENFDPLYKQLTQMYPPGSPQHTQLIQAFGPNLRAVFQAYLALIISCCGVGLPVMSVLLGIMGALTGIQRKEDLDQR
jgi:hypothetical protein